MFTASISLVLFFNPTFLRAQNLHPPPCFTEENVGLTVPPQIRHSHFQGFFAPGKVTNGFSLAVLIIFITSSICTALPEQNGHATPLDFTLLNEGLTTLLHLRHLDFQGTEDFSYGTRGSNPAASITLRASASDITLAISILCPEALSLL
jgi:hypothetical protein